LRAYLARLPYRRLRRFQIAVSDGWVPGHAGLPSLPWITWRLSAHVSSWSPSTSSPLGQ